MYDYSTLQSIFNIDTDTGRLYRTPIGDLPSITTILGKTANNVWLEKWREKVGYEEAARISKEATDRGTLVHTYLERYWNKEDIWPDLLKESSDVRQMVRGLVTKTQAHVNAVWAQEIPLYSTSLKIAGRLDKVGLWNNKPKIIDYKTSKKKKYVKDIKDYFLQTTFYAMAHNELFKSNITECVILIAVDGLDEPQIFEGSTLPFVADLRYRINQFYKDEKNFPRIS